MIAEVAEHDGVSIGIVADACFLLLIIDFSARTNLGLVGIVIRLPTIDSICKAMLFKKLIFFSLWIMRVDIFESRSSI